MTPIYATATEVLTTYLLEPQSALRGGPHVWSRVYSHLRGRRAELTQRSYACRGGGSPVRWPRLGCAERQPWCSGELRRRERFLQLYRFVSCCRGRDSW